MAICKILNSGGQMKTPARRIFERGNSIYLIIGEEYTSLFRSKYGYLESLLSGKFSKSLHKILLRDGYTEKSSTTAEARGIVAPVGSTKEQYVLENMAGNLVVEVEYRRGYPAPWRVSVEGEPDRFLAPDFKGSKGIPKEIKTIVKKHRALMARRGWL